MNSTEADRRARRNKTFWLMVFSGQGLSYSDMKGMDLAEYQEAVTARILYNETWSKEGRPQ